MSPITSVSNNKNLTFHDEQKDVMHTALKDIRSTMPWQNPNTVKLGKKPRQESTPKNNGKLDDEEGDSDHETEPVWLPRHHHNQHSQSHESLNSDNPSKPLSIDDDEADTDLETDRLLGQQRLDDHGFYDDKVRTP